MRLAVGTLPDWQRAAPLIEAALATSQGLETISDVEAMLRDGSYRLWVGDKSAAITEVRRYARKRVLKVTHGGGDLSELIHRIEPEMCSYARAIGCDAMEGTGRKGWERPLASRGYRFGFITLYKDL